MNRECGGKSDCQGDEGQSLQGLRDVLGNAIYYFDLIKLILLMGDVQIVILLIIRALGSLRSGLLKYAVKLLDA